MLSWSNNLILDMYFFINSNIFRHLKLEIALAIPASNDEKYNWSNSAGQGVTVFQRLSQYSLVAISNDQRYNWLVFWLRCWLSGAVSHAWGVEQYGSTLMMTWRRPSAQMIPVFGKWSLLSQTKCLVCFQSRIKTTIEILQIFFHIRNHQRGNSKGSFRYINSSYIQINLLCSMSWALTLSTL